MIVIANTNTNTNNTKLKRNKMKKIKILLKIMLVASIFSVNTLQANVVSARLADQAIQPGDVFSLTISGSGFDVPLDAGGLDISFDSNIIRVAPCVPSMG